ncbi:MAG: S8 family serine peptidase [Coriobacteriaceae bacterium]|jgi:subtilisin family serine protease/uncharacterized protein YjdB|nr:S8 family serine peptidase [Coriobacteriaceae bacterium]
MRRFGSLCLVFFLSASLSLGFTLPAVAAYANPSEAYPAELAPDAPDATDEGMQDGVDSALDGTAAPATEADPDPAGLEPDTDDAASINLRSFDNSPDFESVETKVDPRNGREYEDGMVLVVLKDQPSTEAIDALLEEVPSVEEGPLLLEDRPDGTTLILAEVSDEASVVDAVAELNAQPEVAYAQPNYIYHLDEEFLSPALQGQASQGQAPQGQAPQGQSPASGVDGQSVPEEGVSLAPSGVAGMSNDPYLASQSYLDLMGIDKVWNLAHTDGAVTVAVFDTGISASHPDLTGNLKGTYDVRTGGQVSFDVDPSGHGTHVSGIVAARTGNGLGVASAGWNPGLFHVSLFYLNGSNQPVSNSSYLSAGINYLLSRPIGSTRTVAQAYNIRVINMSLGGYGTTADDPALTAAINNATNSGILVVCAAGNQGSDTGTATLPYPSIPSDYPQALSVIALDTNGNRRASFSNFGPEKDISAPGTSIYSTTSSNAYGLKSGTSMAAPVVSSVAALLFSLKPSATPLEIRTLLQSTATDLTGTDPTGNQMAIGFDPYTGYGRIDAYAALKSLATASLSVNDDVCMVQTNLNQATSPSKWDFAITSGSAYATIDAAGVVHPTQYGQPVTIRATLKGDFPLTASVTYTPRTLTFNYTAHCENKGWMSSVSNGGMAGTSGESLRMEALRLSLKNMTGYAGGIAYQAHVANIGWQEEKSIITSGYDPGTVQGAIMGTERRSLAIESVRFRLTGALASHYDIYYRVHAAHAGWLNWTSDGAVAGTSGLALQVEAIEIRLVEKGSWSPGAVDGPAYINGSASGLVGDISYTAMAHVQNIGNRYTYNNRGSALLGTQGQSLRMEAISLNLNNTTGYSGGIRYVAHVQNIGWMPWVSEGQLSGTAGMSLRVEAFGIELTGDLRQHYDVYYRSHIQNIGWTGWAKNGTFTGSAGYSYRMEALQVVIVKKNTFAPGLTIGSFYQA